VQKSNSISPLLSVRIELFKRGDYDFITVQNEIKHTKQEQALQILSDKEHVEFLYGGAAGGSKSWTGCAFLAFSCLAYAGTKYFIGRESLKRLRESTLITFFKVCQQYGIRRDIDFNYNGQDHFIEFSNGSRIDMLDLRYLPSDPLYERYGSIEYTGGWIEEGGEVNFGAYDTLKTRIGRHLNDKYGILRKLLITCNPKKNWMYSTFYRPSLNGSLAAHMIYLPCLVQENPFIEKDYIQALQSTTDKVKKERLLKGNWDYDDNPNMLCSYDDIAAIFNNDLAKDVMDYYITADIARFGSDRARIAVWKGWIMVEHKSFDISKTTMLQDAINHLRVKYRIPKKRTIADEDGVGGGVVDNCGILGFSNGGRPFDEENYQNLQAQCGYKLAEKINAHEVFIKCDLSVDDKEEVINELQQLQTFDSDSDGKLKLKPKELIKQDIGHSPDWRDLMLMRSYFEYKDHKPQDLNELAAYLP
jgi:phage terminase large subunit